MESIIRTYDPITLDEMSGIKLMNRTDTKFVTTVDRLRLLLKLAHDDYRAQEIDGKRIASYYTAYFDTPDNNMYITSCTRTGTPGAKSCVSAPISTRV